MATPGDMDLVADVVTGLTEEMDGALQEEALTRGWIAAEPSMFWYQRVRTVAQPACRNISFISLWLIITVKINHFRIKIQQQNYQRQHIMSKDMGKFAHAANTVNHFLYLLPNMHLQNHASYCPHILPNPKYQHRKEEGRVRV